MTAESGFLNAMTRTANVTPGNTSDVTRATNLLSEARRTYGRFLPRYLMADQGYSRRPLFKTVHHPVQGYSYHHGEP